jgi:RNA polymerase sigma factor (sigma-70 family)
VDPGEIHHACQGDRRALARLVDELLPIVKVEVVVALYRRAGAVGRDATQEVDDFVQDVLVYLLARDGRVLRRWDPGRGRSLASFVRLVTRHRVARRLEGFRGNPWNTEATEDEQLEGLDFDGHADDAFRHLASRDRLARLLEHLRARLDERGLLLFRLIYVEQRPIPEVCETVGMSRAAVDQWCSRLRHWARGLAEKEAI